MWAKRFAIIILTFISSVATVLADDPTPCPGDPDDPGYDPNACNLPLDTWVYILVIVAVIYGAYRMHQKQKALTA